MTVSNCSCVLFRCPVLQEDQKVPDQVEIRALGAQRFSDHASWVSRNNQAKGQTREG